MEVQRVAGATEPAMMHHAFATTQWSMIAQAAGGDGPDRRAALEELCRIYWRPLYGFARRGGLSQHDAEDLTQGFIADLLARGALAQADASRGRFRTFLLAAFKNYAAHQRARAGALKRGGRHDLVSMDELATAEMALGEWSATVETPERQYDRAWADQLLARALAALSDEYERSGRSALLGEARDALWAGRGEVDYAAMAGRIGTSEGALKVAVHRLRRRFGEHLRAEVSKTLVDTGEVDEEVRYLLAAYGR